MPSVRAFLRAPGAFAVALIRFVRIVVVGGFAAFAIALLLVRFVVFPYVESYRDTLASSLTRQLGHPVAIAAMTTGWDGWNPKVVVEGFRVQDRARPDAAPLLELPEVGLIVSWTSLPLLELRLKELIIDRPRLAIRRDRAGILHVAGIEIDPAQTTDDLALTDWILRQREIVIRDALVTWDDDQRNAPQLVLDRVQFRLENTFGRHRFGLKGTPPAELASPLDLRGDLTATSVRDWQKAEGSLFVRLDYADVAAWREWLPLPAQIKSGKGALRVWSQFAQGEAREVIADLELVDVKARLADDLAELDLAHLSGRIGWRSSTTQREIFTRDLAFVTVGGERHDPANFSLVLRDGSRDRAASGQIEFDQLQLEPLVAFAADLPLSERIRTDLARFAPRGTLARGRLRWDGTPESPVSFAGSAEFSQLGLIAQGAMPGATGLSGRFDVTQDRGEVRVASRDAVVLDLPRIFRAPITLDGLQSIVKWERRDRTTSVRIEQFEFANPDLAGNASGTWRATERGPVEIDLVAQVSRAAAGQIHRYLPAAVDDAARDWVRTAIVRGDVTDVRLKLTGNPAEFPFARGKGGQLVATAKARAVTLAYVSGWPPIEAIDADVRLEGTRLRVDGTRGIAYGVDLGKTRAEIDDVAAAVPVLTIDGVAAGPAAGFLRFVNESPVSAMIGKVTEGIDAAGNGRLALKLGLFLGRLANTTVAGEFTLAEAQLRVPGVPALTKVNGKLTFSEHEVRGRELAMEVLNGPTQLAIVGTEGHVRVNGGGTVGLAAVRREYATAFLDRLSGSVDWTIAVDVRPGASAWVLESPMKGAVVDLPAPLGKTGPDAMPLRIERRDDPAQPGMDFVTASYGKVAQFAAHRRTGESGPIFDRALLSLGRAIERPDAARAERPGLWVRAELPTLSVDDWLATTRGTTPKDGERQDEGLALAGADLDVGQLEALGVRFNDLRLKMREAQGGWTLDLNGREIGGTATWSTPGAGAPNGHLVARLARLAIPARASLPSWHGSDTKDGPREPKADAPAVSPWPAIDVAADALLSKDRDLGRLEFAAQPNGADWRIDRLVLANDHGRLEAEGMWRASSRPQQTKLNVNVEAKEAGAFLAQFGYPDAVQGAPTRIDGQLSWAGAPHEFDFPTLAGTFHINVGPGRFTKIEPGPGKLLGVLSLQSLPRRATLDFRDVFSEGFAFDEITGDVRIASGVMSTSSLKLLGPAAKVDIAGDADLAKETQRLSVHVQPALSSSVSAGAALLFIANPLIGAAVGAGSLLAQAIMKDPIEQIFSYEYTVTGGWSDPVVTRSAGTGAKGSVAPGAPPPTTGAAR